MKIFVTGVAGQLGHDVMNELAKHGIEGVGSDLAPVYSGIADGSASHLYALCLFGYHQRRCRQRSTGARTAVMLSSTVLPGQP